MTKVIGVDFSGAQSDNRTWMTKGDLSGNVLQFEKPAMVRREELKGELNPEKGYEAAALDFPFSVPQDFAKFWLPDATSMRDCWAAAAEPGMDYPSFEKLRDEFVSRRGPSNPLPKRLGDQRFPECFSPLKKEGNPNMLPMTFRGMQMLDFLWNAGCHVPPLGGRKGKPTLLEAMPGAALAAFCLPNRGYKNGKNRLKLREEILNNLHRKAGFTMPNLLQFSDDCMKSDDCLDSMVAAVVAALWIRRRKVFWEPKPIHGHGVMERAKLEGWLYAPVCIEPVA